MFALSIGLGAPFLEAFCFFTISDDYLSASYCEEMIIRALSFGSDLHPGGDAAGRMSECQKDCSLIFLFLAEQILGDHGFYFTFLTKVYLIMWQELKFSGHYRF